MAKLYTFTDADISVELREEAHRMFNYEVHTWLAEVCK